MLKNHKQKRILKKWSVKWTKGKLTQIMRWEKKIICKYSLFKECFKIIIISCDCFCNEDWNKLTCLYVYEYRRVSSERNVSRKNAKIIGCISKNVFAKISRNVCCVLVVLESIFIFCVNQQLGSRINTPFENETCILKKSCFLFELFPFFQNFRVFSRIFSKIFDGCIAKYGYLN